MKILVANLGSTSFKYRLFDMADGERLLARGSVEEIGSPSSRCVAHIGERTEEKHASVSDHAVAVEQCLTQLANAEHGCLRDAGELAAIGFKAVHARQLTGVHRVDARVLEAMEAYADVAPAHNPPYTTAMRLLHERLPHIPLVAAFESGFHETIPAAHRHYAVPLEWVERHGIKRWGFHGASHRYIAERSAKLMDSSDARVISCHLGGSSSLCAIRAGKSIATSMGMSPQTGLPQNNRVGDFDPFALPVLMRETGKTLEQLLAELASRCGLLGLSGVGRDLREIEKAAETNERARLALDVYVAAIRHYLGAYLVLLGGAEAIVFTGGIGENSATIRSAVCDGLDWFGIALDKAKNQSGPAERPIHTDASRVQLWIIPTNEELVVARQVRELLGASTAPSS